MFAAPIVSQQSAQQLQPLFPDPVPQQQQQQPVQQQQQQQQPAQQQQPQQPPPKKSMYLFMVKLMCSFYKLITEYQTNKNNRVST